MDPRKKIESKGEPAMFTCSDGYYKILIKYISCGLPVGYKRR